MSHSQNNNRRPRILICRLSHIGDCILTLPMVSAIRKAKPDAWIAWAVESPSHQLLEHHPDIDQVIRIPKGWLNKPRSIREVRRTLRDLAFDVAIDPQSIAKSALLAWVSGASTRIGFRGPHGRELSSWFNNQCLEPKHSHLVDRSMELLRLLGIESAETVFRLPIQDSAEDYIDRFLDDRGISDSRFQVINPGASWPSKRWENDRFGAVAQRVHEATGLISVITWAGDRELDMATEICANSAGAAILAPRTDLQQLGSLLAAAEIFVGCDTGPLHLAAAVGTTCVGLYGPTRPQDSGAWGTRHFAIQNQYQAGTSRQRRNGSNHAMKTISVAQVVDACSRAVAATRIAGQPAQQNSRDQAA